MKGYQMEDQDHILVSPFMIALYLLIALIAVGVALGLDKPQSERPAPEPRVIERTHSGMSPNDHTNTAVQTNTTDVSIPPLATHEHPRVATPGSQNTAQKIDPEICDPYRGMIRACTAEQLMLDAGGPK